MELQFYLKGESFLTCYNVDNNAKFNEELNLYGLEFSKERQYTHKLSTKEKVSGLIKAIFSFGNQWLDKVKEAVNCFISGTKTVITYEHFILTEDESNLLDFYKNARSVSQVLKEILTT